jgi:hypothetical protein
MRVHLHASTAAVPHFTTPCLSFVFFVLFRSVLVHTYYLHHHYHRRHNNNILHQYPASRGVRGPQSLSSTTAQYM